MSILQLTGTAQCSQNGLSEFYVRIHQIGWRSITTDDGTEYRRGNSCLVLESEQPVLIHGAITRDDFNSFVGAIEECIVAFQLDLFEEDGRLIKRVAR